MNKNTKLLRLFEQYPKDRAIVKAFEQGCAQNEIAEFLEVSLVTILKLKNAYSAKEKLFNKLKQKGIFWSFGKGITFEEFNDNVFIEYVLKYADFDDIELLIALYGKRKVKKIWKRTMMSDKGFLKLNYMLARVFFGMDVEADYFKGLQSERYKKLKLLTF